MTIKVDKKLLREMMKTVFDLVMNRMDMLDSKDLDLDDPLYLPILSDEKLYEEVEKGQIRGLLYNVLRDADCVNKLYELYVCHSDSK